jgi:hypothetical protein
VTDHLAGAVLRVLVLKLGGRIAIKLHPLKREMPERKEISSGATLNDD